MGSGSNFSESDSAIALFGFGVDLAILAACAIIKHDMDVVGFAFAGLVVGWMLGLTLLKTYRTRKPKKKLFFFFIVHLIPLPIALFLATA
jgi:uncharacterized membrane protein SirB2